MTAAAGDTVVAGGEDDERAVAVKESSASGTLAQVRASVQQGYEFLLSTCEQPYLLDQVLAGYREVSR